MKWVYSLQQLGNSVKCVFRDFQPSNCRLNSFYKNRFYALDAKWMNMYQPGTIILHQVHKSGSYYNGQQGSNEQCLQCIYVCSKIEIEIKKYITCKIGNFILSTICKMCFGCSKEPSQWDGSFEYPIHMLWLKNNKINFLLFILLMDFPTQIKALSKGQSIIYVKGTFQFWRISVPEQCFYLYKQCRPLLCGISTGSSLLVKVHV